MLLLNINEYESYFKVGDYSISYDCNSDCSDCMKCSHKFKHDNEIIYRQTNGSCIYSTLEHEHLSHPHFDKYKEYYENNQKYVEQEYCKKYGKQRVLKYDEDCTDEDYVVDCSDEIIGICDNEICNCKINKKYHIFGNYSNSNGLDTLLPIYCHWYNIKYIDNSISSHRLSVKSIISKFNRDNLPLPKKFDLTLCDKFNICINQIKRYFMHREQRETTKKYWENKRKDEEKQRTITEKYKASSRLDKLKEKHFQNQVVGEQPEKPYGL